MFQTKESIGENKVITNEELAKKVNEKEEETIFLRDRLSQLDKKLDQVEEKTKEVKDKDEGKKKELAIEDEVPKLDPILIEEPFLKALKALSGKPLECIPTFIGKIEP